MEMKLSIYSLFMALTTLFSIQMLDKLKEILFTISTVGTEESSLNQSLISSNLIVIPIFFLVLAIIFFVQAKKKN